MNTPRNEAKQLPKDTTLRGSAFNPEWVDRVGRLGTQEPNYEPVRGYSASHTELMRRVAACSETTPMNWDERGQFYREQVEQRLKEDEAKSLAMQKMWKSKEQRLEELQGQLETDLTY